MLTLDAGSASTAAAGISFQSISSVAVPASAADIANPGVIESSLPAQRKTLHWRSGRGWGCRVHFPNVCLQKKLGVVVLLPSVVERSAWNMGTLRDHTHNISSL